MSNAVSCSLSVNSNNLQSQKLSSAQRLRNGRPRIRQSTTPGISSAVDSLWMSGISYLFELLRGETADGQVNVEDSEVEGTS